MQRRGISKHAHHLFALGIAASLGFFALALAVTPVQTRADGSSYSFTISSNANNVNLYTIAGSPSSAGSYFFTISPGVIIGSLSTAQPALATGIFPVGSSLTLVNNGSIEGMGGNGGSGGIASPGGTGSTGGPAIIVSHSIAIDNTNGNIFAGGGGGGGGGAGYSGGGGGGGGQGYGTSSGGSGTVSSAPGGSGGSAAAGAGGSGTGPGGDGGGWGTEGIAGSGSWFGAGGSAGASGAAVSGSGNPALTWLGGSDSTHVKGPVTGVTISTAASCTFDGNTVTSGSSVTAYQTSSVPYGNSCTSETRTCTNGTLSGSYTYPSCTVDAQTGTPLTGYAWSDTIGWISLSGSTYGVSIADDRTISGYAWSEHIGWIKFGSLSSFPTGSGTTAANATLTGASITGWARACAGTQAGDCSTMTSRSDGWDGWIALSGTGYGPTLSGGSLSGYSWGDTNLGWISWSGAATTFQACQATQGYQCVSGNSVHTLADCSQTTDVCSSHGSGYFCATDNNLCTAPPPPSAGTNSDGSSGILRAVPSLVKTGATTKLKWKVDNATSCTVTGNGDTFTGISSESSSCTHTGIMCVTSPVSQRVTYVLHCTGVSGSYDGTADVTIIPKWQEQ